MAGGTRPVVACGYGTRAARAHRPPGVAALPRHHDLRLAVRRADRVRRSSTHAADGGRHLPRHRRRVPARRRPEHRGAHRGDHRAVAGGQARPVHRRDQVLRADGAGAVDGGNSRKHIMSAVDASLRRLQTDYIDLYQLHFDDPNTPIDETLGALDDLVRVGQGPLRRLLELPRLPARARDRAERDARPRPLRLGPAALQPALPRDRARAAPALRRGGHRRDPVQPDRGRHAVGQARPDEAPPRAHGSRSATPARRTRTGTGTTACSRPSRRCASSPTRPGCRCRRSRSRGCSPTRRSPRRSSAPAGPSSWTRRSRPPPTRSTPT